MTLLQFFSINSWINSHDSISNSDLRSRIFTEKQRRAPFQLIFPVQMGPNIRPIAIKGHKWGITRGQTGSGNDRTMRNNRKRVAKRRSQIRANSRSVGFDIFVGINVEQIGHSGA